MGVEWYAWRRAPGVTDRQRVRRGMKELDRPSSRGDKWIAAVESAVRRHNPAMQRGDEDRTKSGKHVRSVDLFADKDPCWLIVYPHSVTVRYHMGYPGPVAEKEQRLLGYFRLLDGELDCVVYEPDSDVIFNPRRYSAEPEFAALWK